MVAARLAQVPHDCVGDDDSQEGHCRCSDQDTFGHGSRRRGQEAEEGNQPGRSECPHPQKSEPLRAPVGPSSLSACHQGAGSAEAEGGDDQRPRDHGG